MLKPGLARVPSQVHAFNKQVLGLPCPDRAPGRALIGLRRWTKVRHSNRKILFIPG